MSILNWIRNGKLGIKPPNSPILPDPSREDDAGTAQVTTACNDEVEAVITTPKKRKRGEYGAYSPDTRAKIARYTIDNGPAKAARHFSTVLGKNVNESTVRSMKKLFLNSPKKSSDDRSFPHSPRGRPSETWTIR